MSTEQQECLPEVLAEEWGARLTTARENLSLSIEQVAINLNLPAKYISQLEACSLEGLPSLVFAKGYIRAYAKLLHIDDDQLVSEFETIHGEGGKGQIRPVSRVRQQVEMNHPVMKISTWLIVIALIGLILWWWQTQHGGSIQDIAPTEESSVQTESLRTPTEDAVVAIEGGTAQLVLPKLDDQPASDSVEEQAPTADQSEAEPEYLTAEEIKKLQTAIEQKEAQTTEEAETATEPESEPVPVPSSADLSEVNFSASFIAECWVSIKDANGKTLFNNLRGKGQSLNVTGKPPLNILIGAADAVSSVSYNGKALNLDPHTRKNIVRLTLPVAE
ncbi:RodZ domain-containing protein [Neptuniibacter sp. QD48_55]|uniref:RodZ domain-containing protein n=1 Tax=Neptuniibacter sp. QD48_55 TaxID=3398212 RepID=UPI0039F587A5